ncbi:molybdopterin guanine dinucleotide-containing S/N-oxide reductase [Pseudonocardia eucalypti]|uniref:Molybdopterin guanine dinucleotide-containing S/N-oxide reductase n=1 Tax=Pseudonocardia eucalypti TaxID=648755 RepID=A0ABP9PV84_9PSEU|nr:biotin/methionine sulfoxide reductase [Pseudonocardia eucalypti]
MDRVPNSTHWGAFTATVTGPGPAGLRVEPHPLDPDPSPLLDNIPGAVHHRSRVRRPAVRRGWLERGPGADPARGGDEFVEVDWDTAASLLAGELGRVRERHGNSAIYGGSYGWASAGRFHHAQSHLRRFLNQIGGYTRSVNTYSNGTSVVVLPHIVGTGGAAQVMSGGTSWPVIARHTELLVAFGGLRVSNAWVAPGGHARHSIGAHLAEGGGRGMRVANFSPLRDDLPDDVPGDWYSIVPGTDVVAMLALCWVLVDEGLADRAFLDRYTVGAERFIAYLRGEPDGQPKDPDWAAPRCGVPAERLRELARAMAARRTLMHVSWSLQRTEHGEQPVWAGVALAALLGQIGRPGGGFGHGYSSMADVGSAQGRYSLPSVRQGTNPVTDFIPVARISDMLLNPGEPFDYNGRRLRYPDIKLVYWVGGNPFHHHQDLTRLRRAFGRPDTVVVHEPYWTATARHADIVLPVTTTLERDDLGVGRGDSHLLAMKRALEPTGRDDYEIFAELAERMGVGKEYTEGRTSGEWLRHLYGEWRERLVGRGYDVPEFDRFWADGVFELPDRRDDRVLFAEFRADPAAHRLDTPSGRIELFSETVAGFGYPDCPGHPAWLEPHDWLGGPRAAEYPLHLIANQPATRLHSQLDMGGHSQGAKVAGRESIRLHPDDAAARGISDGDLVRVHNDLGSCLAGAVLSTDLRPGVAQLPTGAWFDPSGEEVTCAHGNPNVLTADRGSSRLAQGCTGQHALVEVERFEGEPPPVRAFEPPAFGEVAGAHRVR